MFPFLLLLEMMAGWKAGPIGTAHASDSLIRPVGIRGESVFLVNGDTKVFKLHHRLVVVGSDTVRINGTLVDSGYTLDYLQGTLEFFFPVESASTVRITYRYIPFSVAAQYRLYSPESTAGGAAAEKSVSANYTRVDDIDSTSSGENQLLVTGAKTLGVNIGTQSGPGITQSTRLSVGGALEGVTIEAEITDQNTDIPAEGTTKEIEELDRIVIRLAGKKWQGRFGDVDLALGTGGLGRIERRTVGAMLVLEPDPVKFELTYAQPRGKFGRVNLAGRDGVQGPYILSWNGQVLQIVPGSERVYLDGVLLTRGWDADYTIDYTTGAVVFTNRRLISADSRIEAFFQYAEQQYERQGIATEAEAKLGPLNMNATIFREGDNPDRLRGEDITEEQKAYLANIGADTSRAWLDGAVFVGAGNGNYVRDSSGFFAFRGERKGDFSVTFTFVGDSRGDYVYDDTLFAYRYVGPGKGEYVAKKRIVLPERHEFVSAGVKASSSTFRVSTSGLFLRRALNLFSADGATSSRGAAVAEVGWSNSFLSLTYLGFLQGQGFVLPGQDSIVDFRYRWGGTDKDSVRATNELLLEARPFRDVQLTAEAGILNRANSAGAKRSRLHARWGWFAGEAARAGKESRYMLSLTPRVWKVTPALSSHMQLNPSQQIGKAGVDVDFRLRDNFMAGFGSHYENLRERSNSGLAGEQAGILLQAATDWQPLENVSLAGKVAKQSRQYFTEPDKDWTQWLGSLSGNANLWPRAKASVDFDRSYRQVQLKDEVFRYVGPGKGGFSRDSATGRYYADVNGDYERVLIIKNAYAVCREQNLVGGLEFLPVQAVLLSGSIFLRNTVDTVLLAEQLTHNMRIVLKQWEPRFTIFLGSSGSRSQDRTLAVTGKINDRQEYYCELETDYLPGLDSRARVTNVSHIRRLTGGQIEWTEQGWRMELLPIIRLGLDLETTVHLERLKMSAPLYYPGLGQFRFQTRSVSLTRTFTFGQSTKVSGNAGLVWNTASVSQLPYEVALTRPLGLVPSFEVEANEMLSSILSAVFRYRFQNRPDRPAEHTLSAELRAYF